MKKFLQAKYRILLRLIFWPILFVYHFRSLNRKDIYELTRPLRFILLLLLAGIFSLAIVPQGEHMLISLGDFEGQAFQKLFVLLTLCYWSFQIYYGSRILLKLARIRFAPTGIQRIYLYKIRIPVILGNAPFWIFMVAYLKANGIKSLYDAGVLVLLFLLLVVFSGYYHWKTCQDNICEFDLRLEEAERKEVMIRELGPSLFTRTLHSRYNLLIVVFWLLFLFFTYLSIFAIPILQFIGPAAIVLSALSAWISIACVIAIVNTRYFRYFNFSLLLLVLFSSFFNGNNQIDRLNQPVGPRDNLQEHFGKWVEARNLPEDVKTFPVFVIAVEGGGSRSAYWSGSLLSALSDTIPSFADHIFAFSTVSGGSLGAAIFNQLLREDHQSGMRLNKLKYAQSALGKDFLSPLTASMVFPDLLQLFIPLGINAFDRARGLERSWEDACYKTLVFEGKSIHLKESFGSLWSEDRNKKLPSLFINCTSVETGKRAVISNLRLNDVQFHDVIDLMDTIGSQIPLSTAISLSSRFPYITPAAGIPGRDGKLWGHVADGGYFDNSGVTTAGEIIRGIHDWNEANQFSVRFLPYLITIRSRSNKIREVGSFNEFTQPFVSLLTKAFDGEVDYARARVIQEVGREGYIDMKLDVPLDEVPLGWYLSEHSLNVLNKRISEEVDSHYSTLKELLGR
ncbi:MAG: hypothetical protein ACEPOZ_12030 [Marinifilaceae bacterium]